jgi:macrolide transport system ATP-binding/permease protein
MAQFLAKLSLLFRRGRFRSELDEEMAFHRAETEKALRAEGASPEEARSAATRQFGNSARLREESQEVIGFRAETVAQDLRFALRQLRHRPGFALTAILILALGMGVAVAIFGFVDAALLRPLPYADPSRLVDVGESARVWPRSNLSFEDYKDWKRMNRSFSAFDVYTGMGYLLETRSGEVPVKAVRVTDGFFSTLGVHMALGRGFLPGEDQPGRAKIVILDYGAWLERFGGDRNILGRGINLDGDSYTVVGVLPRDFSFAPRGDAELWVPMLDPSHCEQRRTCHNLFGVARLRDGVTVEQARADLKGIAKQLEAEYPVSNRDQGASVQPLAKLIVGDVQPVLLLLLGGAGLLLLIACINVASLLLVRSESRRREIAVRGALGATRVRLARQFVTEGLLLSVAGCAGALLVAGWIMHALARMVPREMASHLPFLALAGMDLRTGLFAAAVALGASLLLAATPTLRLAWSDVHQGLTEGGRSHAGTLWRRMGSNLVIAELAVAVVLLVGAGLLGQSFYRLLHIELGFEPSHLATVEIWMSDKAYPADAQKSGALREVLRQVSSLPGVESAALTTNLPAQCNCNTDWIRVVGKPFHGEHNEVNERDVTAEYLKTLKARMIRGQMFTDSSTPMLPGPVVINESLARRYFPGENPIGKLIASNDLDPKSMQQVVGVVEDVHESALDADVWPTMYEPMYPHPDIFAVLIVRTQTDEASFLPVLVKKLRTIDPNLGIADPETMNQQIGDTEPALLHRFSAWLVGGFAAIALILGVVGLYGVVAYSVSSRTREIGVRMALGAQRGAVYGMILRQAGRLTLVGLVIGLACAVAASLLIRKLLFGVSAWDAPTLAGVALVLGMASMAASFLPARRAASVNPTEALRAE